MNAVDLELGAAIEADLTEIEAAVPELIENGKAARFVTFFFGDTLYGIAAGEVAEVTHPSPVSPLPNAPDSLIGISPLRGEIIAVIDLRMLLSEAPASSPGRSKFVVLRSVENESRPAFPVDRMHEIVTIAESHIDRSAKTSTFLTARARVGETFMYLIDVQSVKATLGA